MLEVLLEKKLPVHELRLLTSERSAGKTIRMQDKTFTFEEATKDSFHNIDFVLSAAENDVAKRFIPLAVKEGAVVIDNSSAYRLDDDVPLVIPEVNPKAATIIALVALQPLHAYATLKRLVVSTYQAVSGAGIKGIQELNDQVEAIRSQQPVVTSAFPYQIAYNLIPQIGNFNEEGYTAEEMKMQNEGRKILNLPELAVNCTCVRVPVYRSHSESILAEFEKEIDPNTAKKLLEKGSGIQLMDDLENKRYPMPLDTSDQDLVYVGRLRKDLSLHKNALSLWCCGDQIRKGAATNAVQIMELLIQAESENKSEA